ncbi:MAG: M2 family metallopeptidase, partial [Bacteroidales bacterium]|nr:M2 family metallopeptidase [Bacteroidales bacterium]
MKRTVVFFTVIMTILWSCTSKQEKLENRMSGFISAYEAKIIPLYKEYTLSDWDANVTGTDEAWANREKASIAFITFYTDKDAFAELKELKESGMVKDPLLSRQLEILYNHYLQGQIDTSLISEQVKMETEITKKYTTFRATVNGKQLSDNDIENILRNSTSSPELQAAWEGHKMIGPVVADEILTLVRHRNKIARQLGFDNYHQMSLKLSGQDPEEITRLFDELDSLTRDNYAQ